jgi:hypothetical protein
MLDCFIGNVAETFVPFLSKQQDVVAYEKMISDEVALAERAVLYGGKRKACITPHALHTTDYLINEFEYDISAMYPHDSLISLSDSIAGDIALIGRLKELGGSSGGLNVSSYALTGNMLALISRCLSAGINVSSDDMIFEQDVLRVRDHFESKNGFRTAAASLDRGLRCKIPEGYVCSSVDDIKRAARIIDRRSRDLVLKANDGEGGFGNLILASSRVQSMDLHDIVQMNELATKFPVVVEEYIAHTSAPSVEFQIPKSEWAPIVCTYACTQLMSEDDCCVGVRISRRDLESRWLDGLTSFGREYANLLRSAGYIGYLDIDALVDSCGDVYVLESNLRRTGGTHIHDFCSTVFGPEYLTTVTAIARSLDVSRQTASDVMEALEPMLLRSGRLSGVVPVVLGQARCGSVSLMAVAPSDEEAERVLMAAQMRLS